MFLEVGNSPLKKQELKKPQETNVMKGKREKNGPKDFLIE